MKVLTTGLLLLLLVLFIPKSSAKLSIQILLLRNSEPALQGQPDMVKCIAEGTTGTPVLRLHYGERANAPGIKRVKQDPTLGGAVLWVETILPRDGWIYCTVTDGSDIQEEKEYLSAKVCPSPEAIVVRQKGKVPRPSGEAVLSCFFRFSENDLYYYMWVVKETNTPFYTYEMDTEQEDIPTTGEYAELFVKEDHIITDDSVTSTVTLSVDMANTNTYRCEVTLRKNFNNECAKEIKLQFAEPPISVRVFQSDTSAELHQPPNITHAIVCTVNHSTDEPNINLSYENNKGQWSPLPGNKIPSLVVGVSRTTKYFAQASVVPNKMKTIACSVNDSRGSYKKQISPAPLICPRSDMVTIQQESPVPSTGGMVTLTCSAPINKQELQSLSWIFTGNQTIIYDYNKLTGIERKPFGKVSNELGSTSFSSRLNILVGVNDVRSVMCSVSSEQFLNCSHTHNLELKYQQHVASTDMGLIVIIAVLVVLILIGFIGLLVYINRRKDRQQKMKHHKITYTQLLSDWAFKGGKGYWGKKYATVLQNPEITEEFKLDKNGERITAIEMRYGHWNNRSVLGALRVRFEGDGGWQESSNFHNFSELNIVSSENKTSSHNNVKENFCIAGVQVRDGHMVDQITFFRCPTLEPLKFGWDQGGDLHPFESNGYLVGVRGFYSKKIKGNDKEKYSEKERDGDWEGIIHLRFKWDEDEDHLRTEGDGSPNTDGTNPKIGNC